MFIKPQFFLTSSWRPGRDNLSQHGLSLTGHGCTHRHPLHAGGAPSLGVCAGLLYKAHSPLAKGMPARLWEHGSFRNAPENRSSEQ